jgi:acyl-CoA thioesterase FadM
MNRAIAYKRRLSWADCDPTGLWRFTSALSFAEEAEVSLLREAGVLESLYGRLPRVQVDYTTWRPLRLAGAQPSGHRPFRS